MTQQEFENRIAAHWNVRTSLEAQMRANDEREKKFIEEAEQAAFAQSRYTFGQPVEVGGLRLFVGGAQAVGRHIYLKLFYPKKDGSMSSRQYPGRPIDLLI